MFQAEPRRLCGGFGWRDRHPQQPGRAGSGRRPIRADFQQSKASFPVYGSGPAVHASGDVYSGGDDRQRGEQRAEPGVRRFTLDCLDSQSSPQVRIPAKAGILFLAAATFLAAD